MSKIIKTFWVSCCLLAVVIPFFCLAADALAQDEAGIIKIGPPEGSQLPSDKDKNKSQLELLIDRVAGFVFWFGLIIGPLLILLGTFLYATSAGEARRVQRGKGIIIWTLVGMAVAFLARFLTSFLHYILF